MLRIPVDFLRRPDLHNPPPVHHGNPVAQIINDVQIVGNEQHGKIPFPVNIPEQIQNLCSNRDVKRRNRFIRNHKLRVQHQRCSDTHPLPLSSGELLRVTVRIGSIQPDSLQHPVHFLHLLLRRTDPMGPQRLPQCKSNRLPRIQRTHRILKNSLHLFGEFFPPLL